MKRTDFTHTGGFPLEQRTLSDMQDTYLEILKAIIGHFGLSNIGNYIISGCEIVGVNITPGMTYIDGDLASFPGAVGDATTKIAKITTLGDGAFEDGNNFPVYSDYTAAVNATGVALSAFTIVPKVADLVNIPLPLNIVYDPNFGTANPSVLQRIAELEKKNAVFQVGGGMVFWNKAANLIPPGWHEVVNWRGRMPVGMDITVDGTGAFVNPEFSPVTSGGSDPGRTGGAKSKTLLIAEIPAHTHSVDVSTGGATAGGGSGVEPTSGQTGATGGGQAFSLLNPFQTVLFIEWTGV
jgi:hypothetical protein